MNKQKRNTIEAFIYASKLSKYIEGIGKKETGSEESNVLRDAKKLSGALMFLCKKQIDKLRLNNLSFQILVQELEGISFEKFEACTENKLFEMLKSYNYYLKLVSN